MRRLTKKHKHEFEVNHFGRNRCRICLKTPDEVTIDSQATEIRDLKKRLRAIGAGLADAFPEVRISKLGGIIHALDMRKPFKPEGET